MYLFFLFWERDLNWFWTAKQLEAMYIYVYIYINTCLSPFPVIVTKEDFYTFCRGSRTKLNLHLPLLLAIGTTLYVWCIYIIYDIHILCSLYIYIYIVEDVYIYIYILYVMYIYIYITQGHLLWKNSTPFQLNSPSRLSNRSDLEKTLTRHGLKLWVGWKYLRKGKQLHKPKENLAWLIHLQKSLHKILEMNIA